MSDNASPDTPEQPPKAPPPRRGWGRTLWRIAKWVLIVLLVLLVVIIGLVGWVAGTRSGTAFAWHQANRFLPDTLHIDNVDGRLIGPLHVDGVSYRTDTMTASVGSIDFDMDFSAIWHRTVHIQHLDVNNVDYTVTGTAPEAPETESQPFSMPEQIDLPVTVVLDRLSISNVKAITAPDAEPLRVDRLALVGATLDNARWQIKSLTGHGPMFDLDAHAGLTPNSGYATNLHAKATLRLDGYAPIDATANVSGDLADLKLDANVGAPYNIALQGQVTNALKSAAVDVGLHINDLQTPRIAESLPRLTASADVTAQGPVNDLALNLSADVDSADYGKARLDGGLHYTPESVAIDQLKIGVPATNGQLVANGQVALAEGNAMNLTVDWQNLAWPLTNTPQYKSPDGTIKLDGTLDDYRLDTKLGWQVVGQTAGKLAASGSGSTKAFDLKSLDISGGPGHITGHAKTRWSPSLDVDAHLSGEQVDLGAVVADVPSKFNMVADVTATQTDDGAIHANLKQLTAHGSLRRQPLDLKAKAQYLGDHVVIDTMHLVSGAATADVTGTYGWTPDAKLDGRWSVHSSDLSTIMPGLAGELNTEGRVSGRVKAPIAKATLKADNVAAFGTQLASADLDADVDWSGQRRSQVSLVANGIESGGQTIRKVTLDLDGTPGRHNLSLDLDSDIAKADLALTGALNKNTYEERFTLQRLTAGYGDLAPWTLASPASGRVSAKAQSIKDACLASGSARLCIDGSHDAKASVAHVDLKDFDYNYAKPYFPEGLAVSGAVSGTVDARVPTGGAPRLKADLQTTAGRVAMTNATGETVQILDMQPGSIRAQMANNGLDASLDLPLAGSDGIRGQVSVAAGSGAMTSHGLDGQVHIGLDTLGFIAKLSPEVDTFDGKLAGDLRLSGTLAKPNVLGNTALTASKIVLVSPGLTLTDVSLAAQGQGDAIGLTAAAKSGGGTLNANGQIALDDSGQNVELAITGNRFQVANIPDVTAYVSPDLKVAVTPSKVAVSGSVTIPEASVTPKNLPESGVTTVSSDQVIVTEEDSKSAAVARAIDANVNVILGKKVHIDAFGLKADLDGNLRVVQQPGDATPTGTGAINVKNGSYQAYGQNLDIQTGKILFAGGPVSQPGLDIKAARYPNDDVTVGVHVRGSLSQPQLELFSDPSMTQSEQLSWLLLGRPLDDTTGQQSSLVARAALALGSSRGNKVLQNIGDKLGVNVGLGAGAGQSSDETALTVGKYLSPRLYVSYGLGLFDQVSTVSMRYTLSSHWSLETSSSGQATGGDVIWSFDH
ncbi:translocation/assembly module TamB domain-containing protein [Salinisphaera sp. Q1T1-3]|uniref:translocation/assembly module TamB domain-containing protein n=1 Tax=Salinisphaera sp. Q1T1-3 TaxID=2321229 RepID=UPI000E744E7C|nr:translocation/assembly module TamB domain-containing protein [Salinisphaera sp. Q1T1-3]RJS92552.1 hypothetical protein D3260_11565 [Salinisphaera sp. Q1T1-3]